MLDIDTHSFLQNRHIVTKLDFLTSWVPETTGSWAIWCTSSSPSLELEVIEKTEGRSPHPVISSSLFALQSHYDYLIEIAQGKALNELTLATKHLSMINHIGGAHMLNCSASNFIAKRVVNEIYRSCDRVQTRLSLDTELPKIGMEIMQLGCGRVFRAA